MKRLGSSKMRLHEIDYVLDSRNPPFSKLNFAAAETGWRGECYCNGGSSSAGRMTGEPWCSTIIHLCPTRS